MGRIGAWVLIGCLVGPPGWAAEVETSTTSSTSVQAVPQGLEEALEGLDLTGTPALPPEAMGPSGSSSGERAVPDYDGLPPEDVRAGDVLLWGPRLVLLPAHVLLKYGVRKPVVGLLTVLEEHRIPDRVNALLTWRDGKSSIMPTFFADFGLRPSIGLVTAHRDLVQEGDFIQASGTFWGSDWIRVAGEASTPMFGGGSGALGVFGSYVSRPDQPFFGLGSATHQDDRGNFRRQEAQGGLRMTVDLGGLHRVILEGLARDATLTDGESIGVLERFDGGLNPYGQPLVLPPGWVGRRANYVLLLATARLRVDTRPERDPELITDPGTGVLLEPWFSYGSSPSEDLSLVRYGAELAGFWDVSGLGHVLAFRTRAELSEGLGAEPIPFTERPALGGLEDMRAFLNGRFVGDSTLMATLSYRYPIWYLLEAELFASLGNAWDKAFEGFDLERQYLAFGIGMRTAMQRSTGLQLLLGLGTERLDQDFEIASVRVAIGLVEGF